MEFKPVKGLRPFTKFLMTIGELPSSYLVSMTYEEQLLWFCNYLEKVVIPTINNNSEAVIELQEYVANYFDNLDVQEEINNKLDEMAESGELARIIAEYLDLEVLFCYDTIADLEASVNVKDGCSAYCLGKDTYDDGKGAFYKIREITISDVIDGYNIVAITNTEDLIGERLPNYEINTINSTLDTLTTETIPGIQGDITTITETTIPAIQGDITTITDTTIPAIQGDITTITTTTIPGVESGLQTQIDTINNTTIPGVQSGLQSEINNIVDNEQTVKSLVVIADSYGVMDGVTNFATYMKQFLNLDNDHFYNNSYGGVGFDHSTDNKTFITLVNECANNLSEARRNGVSDVLIAGGYNDQWSSGGDIRTAAITCINRAHEVFPHAKIWIAHIGWSTNNSDLQHTFKSYYDASCLTPYSKFVINSQNILRGDLISIDNVHPNNEGLQYLAMNLITGLQTGSCYPVSEYKYLTTTGNLNLGVVQQNNDVLTFEMYDYELGASGTANGTEFTAWTLKNDSMISGHQNCSFNVQCMFTGSGQYVMGECIIKIDQRSVKITPICLKSDGTNYFTYTSIRFNHYLIQLPHKNI